MPVSQAKTSTHLVVYTKLWVVYIRRIALFGDRFGEFTEFYCGGSQYPYTGEGIAPIKEEEKNRHMQI